MKRLYLFIFLIFALLFNYNFLFAASDGKDTINANTQETLIEKWKIAFTLPSDKWNLAESHDSEDSKAMYRYKREAIIDSKGNKIMPNIAFIFEKLEDNMDAVNYSIQVRMKLGPIFKNIKNMFVPGDDSKLLSYNNALGYFVEYSYPADVTHTVVVVHAVNERIGIQVIMDSTNDVYPIIKDEFESTLKSLRFIDK
jgi:hypothetical protein